MFTHPLEDHILTRGFHYKATLYVGGQHAAADYIRRLGTTAGSPIRAVADGVVVGVGWDFYSGFFVAIDHVGGWRSFYRHLYGQAPVVVGQRVSQGQIIGNLGNTGWSQGAHLHFDLWNRNKKDSTAFYKNGWWAHDPELYLGQEEDMEQSEFNEMFAVAIKEAQIYAHDATGNTVGAKHPVGLYLNNIRELQKQEVFNEAFAQAVKEAKVFAYDADEETVGAKHSVGFYLYCIRLLQEQVERLEAGKAAYTDARAIKAVKDALPD